MLFDVIINLFLVVMTIIRCYMKKLFRFSYIASGENRIWKKIIWLDNLLIKLIF